MRLGLEKKIPIDYGQPMTYTLNQLETKAITFLNESKRYKNMSVKTRRNCRVEGEGSGSLGK
jgi:hypothetical protein